MYCPDRLDVCLEEQTDQIGLYRFSEAKRKIIYWLRIFLSSRVRIFLEQTPKSC